MPQANMPILLGMTLALGLVNTTAFAASDGQWFGALKTSIGKVTINKISDRGSIGNGMQIGNDVDGKLKEKFFDDYTAAIGVALGQRFGYWQISTEFMWRYRTDWNVVAPTPSIQTITNIFNDVETSSLLVNLAKRGPVNQLWSWELGAGIGLVRNEVVSEYVEREVPGVRPELKFRDVSKRTEFSYNAFAGITRYLDGPWTFNLRYRFIALGDLRAGPFPERPSRVFGDHSSHELQFSLERDF